MYIAYLCYPHLHMGDDLDDCQPDIRFEEPERYLYKQIVPITFSPLKDWKHDDTN